MLTLDLTAGRVSHCHLLDKLGAQIANVCLLIACIACLAYKWSKEEPRRAAWSFYTDVSKQLFGAAWLHFTNVVFSIFVTTDQVDDCDWYIVNIIFDCTVGAFLMVKFLELARESIKDKPWAPDMIQMDGYRGSGIEFNTPRRVKQILFWVFGPVTLARLVIMVVLFFIGDAFILTLHSLLGVLPPFLREFVTILLIPMPLNILQFYYIDTRIKQQSTTPPPAPPSPAPPPPAPPTPAEDDSIKEPLIKEESMPLCGGTLMHTKQMVERKRLIEFLNIDIVRIKKGLEQYTPGDIDAFADIIMGGKEAQAVHIDQVRKYLALQRENVDRFKKFDKTGYSQFSEKSFIQTCFSKEVFESPGEIDLNKPIRGLDCYEKPIRDNVWHPVNVDGEKLFAVDVSKRRFKVIDRQQIDLWENYKPHEGLLRLAAHLWDKERLSEGQVVEIGLVVQPKPEQLVTGMITESSSSGSFSSESHNRGAWAAMWNLEGVSARDPRLRPVEGDSEANIQELCKMATQNYEVVKKRFAEMVAHGQTLNPPVNLRSQRTGRNELNSRVFLTYLQQFLPEQYANSLG